MIQDSYDANFISVSKYVQKSKLSNLNMMFLENTNHGKLIRNSDFTLLPTISLHLPSQTNLYLIDMKYSFNEGYRPYAVMKYDYDYQQRRNAYDDVFPSIELTEVIEKKSPILVVCDFDCDEENDTRVKNLINYGYKKKFDSIIYTSGIWRNKTFVYEKTD
jgi:hypothetical protein